MKKILYLDHSATTPVYPQVIELMVQMMEKDYGNPSSLHRMGLIAEKSISKAREQVAKVLEVKAKEIIFTSGGTEANNLAIRGIAHQYANRGKHLITTTIEHPSVLHTFQGLEKEGFAVTYLQPDVAGFIDLEELKAALTSKTIFASIMHVNNEIGSVQPIAKISQLLKAFNQRIIFHVDAIQSFGKLILKPRLMGIDLLTISGHKIHGPKGIGALYVDQKIELTPLIFGGGQERKFRSGTENVPGIVGLGQAAELIAKERSLKINHLRDLKAWFINQVSHLIPNTKINGPEKIKDIESEISAPQIINLSFPGLKAEVLLHALEENEIYISTGSACHSRKHAPSHVLQAIKLSQREIESAIRISLSYQTTREDLQRLLDCLSNLVQELRTLMQR